MLSVANCGTTTRREVTSADRYYYPKHHPEVLVCTFDEEDHPWDYHLDGSAYGGARWPTTEYLANPRVTTIEEANIGGAANIPEFMSHG